MIRKLPLIGALLFALATPDDAAAANPQVLVKTSAGEFVIELYPDKAPISVENFLQYVKDGFYAGTIFHRVIGSFMIQGGGFTKEMYEGALRPKATRAPIAIESKNGLKNDIGWVAMARTSDPNSATSQFFINVSDNDFLDYPGQDGWGYCVFGRVVEGMDTVEAIKGVKTGSRHGHQDVPVEDVIIEQAIIVA